MSIDVQPQDGSVGHKLPLVLTRIVSELQHAAGLIERVEPQISSLAGPVALQLPETMEALQGIDLAIQKIRGIAEFLDTLSTGISDSYAVDLSTALNLVRLTELRDSLDPQARQSTPPQLDAAAGEFEFF